VPSRNQHRTVKRRRWISLGSGRSAIPHPGRTQPKLDSTRSGGTTHRTPSGGTWTWRQATARRPRRRRPPGQGRLLQTKRAPRRTGQAPPDQPPPRPSLRSALAVPVRRPLNGCPPSARRSVTLGVPAAATRGRRPVSRPVPAPTRCLEQRERPRDPRRDGPPRDHPMSEPCPVAPPAPRPRPDQPERRGARYTWAHQAQLRQGRARPPGRRKRRTTPRRQAGSRPIRTLRRSPGPCRND
jgi:hypothetical protein